MRGRVAELRALRERVENGQGSAYDAARRVGMALRGSGASFGFPRVSALSTLVETARDEDLLRRVEGLITELSALADERDRTVGSGWLARAAGVEEDPIDASAADGDTAEDFDRLWHGVAQRAGIDQGDLTARVAAYFGLAVANTETRTRAALRLVPEALLASGRVVPLREDSMTITVATSDPTALAVERELERLTGRRPVFEVAPPAVVDALISEISGERRPVPTARAGTIESSRPPDPAAVGSDRAEADRPGPEEHPPSRRHPRDPVPVPDDREAGQILVVDDEPSARLLIRALLEKRGYSVLEAADGVAALERISEGAAVDLVVADLDMPRMDGLELIWALRDAHTSAHLPVIVVTGEADEIHETQLMEEGADDYIRKPLDPRLFLARVESTVRRIGV